MVMEMAQLIPIKLENTENLVKNVEKLRIRQNLLVSPSDECSPTIQWHRTVRSFQITSSHNVSLCLLQSD